ncbi:FAD-dependent oxidoreductase [Bacillaceae bacterium SIJ1]|uniref:FAD-dependent oxidoreductase n=1 Tax=Litoribacterium kuwaitense TaxID=1398745 RepID=UPI0013EBACCF|nr:FAD-dependent oxidoreductase [Litoribacterium kuwaitense]NGP46090.1 FAD-dependent oxidoreductase [Litoribacterium kuwaitense]
MNSVKTDVLIAGGSTGGCAAALAAAKQGLQVILTEETDWIGGQFTSQAVPPDEHKWIEQFGCTASYREFRERVRNYYKTQFPLTPEAEDDRHLNPGSAIVTGLAFEPKVALRVLQDMLAPYEYSGRLTIHTMHQSISAKTDSHQVKSVTFEHVKTKETLVVEANIVLDATEMGDLLPMTDTAYVTGAESKADTGEPHALEGEADPLDMQAFTQVIAMDIAPGEDNVIEKPAEYDFWKKYRADFWPGSLLSWKAVHPPTLNPMTYGLYEGEGKFPLWAYRRIIDPKHFHGQLYQGDISLMNWPQSDYWLGPVVEVTDEEKAHHLYMAKQLSLSLLYWMQTEAPNDSGGIGYPELRLRKDVVGTSDGVAKYPYIREARRIKARHTILEQHVSGPSRPAPVPDSVGVGAYHIDLHPSTGQRTYIDFKSWPFQIPLGSMIPIETENLLPACKNIGTTHITNGCYRLHPVEWNIGESAGLLAAFSLREKKRPKDVYEDEKALSSFQAFLRSEGVELDWPEIEKI